MDGDQNVQQIELRNDNLLSILIINQVNSIDIINWI